MSGMFVSASGWTGGTINFDDGVDDETYSYDTELGSPTATVYQVAEDLVRWFNDAARGWSGSSTATLSVRASSPYLLAEVTLSAPYDIGIGGGLSLTGWVDGAGLARLAANSCSSGVSGAATMSGWAAVSMEKGSMCAAGSWTMSGGGSSTHSRKPRAVLVCDEAESVQMAQALRGAGSPRLAHCYDSINDAWRLVSLGEVRARQVGLQHIQYTPEVMG